MTRTPIVDFPAGPALSSDGRLLIGRCNACDSAHYYPRPWCPFCHSDDVSLVESSGRGTIYSYSIMRPKEGDPLVIAFVTLAEGVSLLTNIVDGVPDEVAVDQPVELIVDARTEPWAPFFRKITA